MKVVERLQPINSSGWIAVFIVPCFDFGRSMNTSIHWVSIKTKIQGLHSVLKKYITGYLCNILHLAW